MKTFVIGWKFAYANGEPFGEMKTQLVAADSPCQARKKFKRSISCGHVVCEVEERKTQTTADASRAAIHAVIRRTMQTIRQESPDSPRADWSGPVIRRAAVAAAAAAHCQPIA